MIRRPSIHSLDDSSTVDDTEIDPAAAQWHNWAAKTSKQTSTNASSYAPDTSFTYSGTSHDQFSDFLDILDDEHEDIESHLEHDRGFDKSLFDLIKVQKLFSAPPLCFCQSPASRSESAEFGVIYECHFMAFDNGPIRAPLLNLQKHDPNDPSKHTITHICGFHVHWPAWKSIGDGIKQNQTMDHENPELGTCPHFNFTYCVAFRVFNSHKKSTPLAPRCFCNLRVALSHCEFDQRQRICFVCPNFYIEGAKPKCSWFLWAEELAFHRPKYPRHSPFLIDEARSRIRPQRTSYIPTIHDTIDDTNINDNTTPASTSASTSSTTVTSNHSDQCPLDPPLAIVEQHTLELLSTLTSADPLSFKVTEYGSLIKELQCDGNNDIETGDGNTETNNGDSTKASDGDNTKTGDGDNAKTDDGDNAKTDDVDNAKTNGDGKTKQDVNDKVKLDAEVKREDSDKTKADGDDKAKLDDDSKAKLDDNSKAKLGDDSKAKLGDDSKAKLDGDYCTKLDINDNTKLYGDDCTKLDIDDTKLYDGGHTMVGDDDDVQATDSANTKTDDIADTTTNTISITSNHTMAENTHTLADIQGHPPLVVERQYFYDNTSERQNGHHQFMDHLMYGFDNMHRLQSTTGDLSATHNMFIPPSVMRKSPREILPILRNTVNQKIIRQNGLNFQHLAPYNTDNITSRINIQLFEEFLRDHVKPLTYEIQSLQESVLDHEKQLKHSRKKEFVMEQEIEYLRDTLENSRTQMKKEHDQLMLEKQQLQANIDTEITLRRRNQQQLACMEESLEKLLEENTTLAIEAKLNLEKPKELKCQVCFSADVECALVPCFHSVYCLNCANKLKECALCRIPKFSIQKVYLC